MQIKGLAVLERLDLTPALITGRYWRDIFSTDNNAEGTGELRREYMRAAITLPCQAWLWTSSREPPPASPLYDFTGSSRGGTEMSFED